MARTAYEAKLLRFSPMLAERIEALAKRDYRTFTGQITMMLEQWLTEHDRCREQTECTVVASQESREHMPEALSHGQMAAS
jgi:hypothetical protein